MWTVIFSVLTVGACLFCLIGCVVNVRSAVAEQESLHKRLRSCESRAQSSADSVEQLTEIVTGLVQSQKMQRVRTATKHATSPTGEPNASVDPEAWRNWKNAQLRAGTYNQ
jgi:hypothetical protein